MILLVILVTFFPHCYVSQLVIKFSHSLLFLSTKSKNFKIFFSVTMVEIQDKILKKYNCNTLPITHRCKTENLKDFKNRKLLRLQESETPIKPTKIVFFIHILTHEVEVPGPLRWDHEEAQEPIREQHLDPFVVGRHISLGVVALVCVLPAPVITTGSQLVGRQGA